LFKVYRSGKIKDFDEKYLQMLSLTGVKSYKDILKPFGLDANSETFWQYGLDLIKEYISELEKLDKEVFKK
jgi:oligoendopeptidase F